MLENDKRFKQAVQHFARAAELDPSFAPAHEHAARVYLQLGMPSEAENHYAQLAELSEDLDVLLGLAKSREDRDAPEEAVSPLAKAVKVKPDDPDLLARYARALDAAAPGA